MLTSGSYATGIREPCQGRNAAALSGSSCVPWGRLGRVNCRGNVCDWCSTQDARIFNIAGKTLLREGAVLTLSSNQALPWQVILTQESFVEGTLIFFIYYFKYEGVSCIMDSVVISLLTLVQRKKGRCYEYAD